MSKLSDLDKNTGITDPMFPLSPNEGDRTVFGTIGLLQRYEMWNVEDLIPLLTNIEREPAGDREGYRLKGTELKEVTPVNDDTVAVKFLYDDTARSSAGYSSVMGVTYYNELIFWGRSGSYTMTGGYGPSDYGQRAPLIIPNIPKTWPKIKRVILTYGGALVHFENNDLYGMGSIAVGEFGPISDYITQPTLLLSNVVYISTTNMTDEPWDAGRTMVILEDGTVLATGSATSGKLGIGDFEGDVIKSWTTVKIPYVDSDEKPIKIMSLGGTEGVSVVLSDKGRLYSAGSNKAGRLGLGKSIDESNVFQQIKGIDDVVVDISSSTAGSTTDYYWGARPYSSLVAITDKGEIYGWGHNQSGELGFDHQDVIYTPVKLETSKYGKISQLVSAQNGPGIFGFITEDHSLYLAGNNEQGQLGLGDKKEVTGFQLILENVKKVKVSCSAQNMYGRTAFMAIMQDGEIYGWGWNERGNLGLGHTDRQMTPAKVMFNYKHLVKDIVLTGKSTRITTHLLLEDGRVYSAGSNEYRQVVRTIHTEMIPRFIRSV